MRKPRSDSKLLNLPDDRKAEILDLLDTPGVSLKDAQAALAREGLRVVPSSLSHFYSQEKSKRIIAQRLQSLAIARSVHQEAGKNPSLFAPAMVEQISQLAFEISIQSNADPDVVKQFFDMVLKAREQDIASRKLALLEEKAKQAEKAAGITSDSKLSAEEKDRRLKQIFGVAS